MRFSRKPSESNKANLDIFQLFLMKQMHWHTVAPFGWYILSGYFLMQFGF